MTSSPCSLAVAGRSSSCALAGGLQRDDGGRVQGVVVAALRDGLVHRRLEALLVDDQSASVTERDLARGQLDVVRLGARARSGSDTARATRDALGDELERVERRHDLQLARLGRVGSAAAAGRREERRRAGSTAPSRGRCDMKTIFINGAWSSNRPDQHSCTSRTYAQADCRSVRAASVDFRAIRGRRRAAELREPTVAWQEAVADQQPPDPPDGAGQRPGRYAPAHEHHQTSAIRPTGSGASTPIAISTTVTSGMDRLRRRVQPLQQPAG